MALKDTRNSAICKTCGASPGFHIPSTLDPQGIGHPAHKIPEYKVTTATAPDVKTEAERSQDASEDTSNSIDNTPVGEFVAYQSGSETKYTLYGGRVSFTEEQKHTVEAYIKQRELQLLKSLLEKKIYYISGAEEAVPVSVVKELEAGLTKEEE